MQNLKKKPADDHLFRVETLTPFICMSDTGPDLENVPPRMRINYFIYIFIYWAPFKLPLIQGNTIKFVPAILDKNRSKIYVRIHK